MVRIRFLLMAAAMVIGGLSFVPRTEAVVVQDSFLAGNTWAMDTGATPVGGVNGIFVQGFAPYVAPAPNLGLGASDMLSLEEFSFYKSGLTDLIGDTADGGPTSVQLVLLNTLFPNLQGLTTSSGAVVGLSTNSFTSTTGFATGAPITFKFNGLQLRYGNSYAAMVASIDSTTGAITPVKIAAITADYAEQVAGSGDYHPTANYGGETDYNFATSNYYHTDSFGSYFDDFTYAGDANFLATMNFIVPGDFNNDGQFTIADVQAMMSALADLNDYTTTNKLSPSDLKLLGDFNQDGVVDNSDIQAMISALANGGGTTSLAAVPEPTSALLLALGGLMLFKPARGRLLHMVRA